MKDEPVPEAASPALAETSDVAPAASEWRGTGFVRGGGTSTHANDMRIAELKADSEARRAVADRERKLTLLSVEEGGAKMFTNRLTENPGIEQTYIELHYVSTRGEPVYWRGKPMRCLADIWIIGPGERGLNMICKGCMEKGNIPMDQCQITLRQSEKKWQYSNKRIGDIILDEEYDAVTDQTTVKVYKSAGTVVESDPFRCSTCLWGARIVDNKVRPL